MEGLGLKLKNEWLCVSLQSPKLNLGFNLFFNCLDFSVQLETLIIWDLCFCHTRPHLEISAYLKSGKSQLARWATKWHDYQNITTHPPTDPPYTLKCGISQQPLVGSYPNSKLV